jgi:myo-inositol-1(or 4)-monophosphatase
MAPPEISHDDLLACAVEAATEATQHAVNNRHRRCEVAATFAHDVKLDLDTECQQKAEAVIHAAYPAHAILGEEGNDETSGDDPVRWIIDPIDGTVNFSHGFSRWCCAIAVQHEGETVAGCVLGPDVDQLFTATATSEARLNGNPIAVSNVSNLDQAMVTTGLDDLRHFGYRRREIVERFAGAAQKVRIMGCAALDMCCVATGACDGYFEAGIFAWDVEAAGLIIRRAGGRAAVLRTLPLPHQYSYIASNGHIHDALHALIMAPPRDSTPS